MATYSDFSSLLQLGVGIGIGLSLFRAPVDIRTARLEKVLNSEIIALRGGGAAAVFRHKKWRALQALRLQYLGVRQDLERYQFPFMVAAAIGAMANLCALIKVALFASVDPGTGVGYFLVFISSVYFLIVLALLEVLARWHLGPIEKRLKAIQLSTDANSSAVL
jgi:hypothetical protein